MEPQASAEQILGNAALYVLFLNEAPSYTINCEPFDEHFGEVAYKTRRSTIRNSVMSAILKAKHLLKIIHSFPGHDS